VTIAEDLPPEHEYDGTLARYYDAYFTGLDGEAEFYTNLAVASSGPVLELGCGTGRTLIPIAEVGSQISGLERSGSMLDRARQRIGILAPDVGARVDLHLGDMRSFDLGRHFDLITLPYRTFQHLLTVDDQHRALDCICRHLAPGGRVALNVYDPLMDISRLLTNPTDPEPATDAEFTDGEGHRVRARYLRGYDPANQWMVQHFWFDQLEGKQTVETLQARLTLRYAFRFEMEHLLSRHGLRVVSLAGGFGGEAYEGWGEQVWVAAQT